MRTLFYFVVVGAFLLIGSLSGCSDEFTLDQAKPTNVAAVPGSALERALERADEFFAQMGEATRTPRRVGTVGTLVGVTTRSESDTLLFLVNYADNMGFALLGADPAVNDIYAISPTGSLTEEDVNNNPVLADFLYDAISYASSVNPGVGDTIVGLADYWHYRNLEIKKPMLDSMAAKWNQVHPYNMFTTDEQGNMCPVGCLNVSMGMLLSYYRKPDGLNYVWSSDSIQKFNFDWDVMLSSPKKPETDVTVAEMFEFLGSKKLLNIKYEKGGSSGDPATILPTIKALGGGNKLALEREVMQDKIDVITSFLLYGTQINWLFETYKYKAAPIIGLGISALYPYDAHAWIIDGVITRERCRTDKNGRPISIGFDGSIQYTPALPMWHCVWGVPNVKANGWYVYLKDQNKMDSIQYDPFSNRVTISGLWPTGVKLASSYKEWEVCGGCFPEIDKISFIP